jgi:hypothetical protein
MIFYVRISWLDGRIAIDSIDQRKVRPESLAYNPIPNFAGAEMLRW